MSDNRNHNCADAISGDRTVAVPGAGACLVTGNMLVFTAEFDPVEAYDARHRPDELLERLSAGAGVVLTGPYAYIDAVYRYCQRYQRRLVDERERSVLAEKPGLGAALVEARRRKLHHLFVAVRGEDILGVTDPPETAGLQEWLEKPLGDRVFLLPVRRLQRILADMRRARDGISIPGLDTPVVVRPSVYVPADTRVPAMLGDFRCLFPGRRVLDIGTGTGVLALLAAEFGAEHVVSADNNPLAVENARINVSRAALEDRIEVRGPADLFDCVSGDAFDIIIFNAPWVHGEPQTVYDRAIYDPGGRVLKSFIAEAPQHLSPGGSILLQYSNISQRTKDWSMEELEALLSENGLKTVSRRCIARKSRLMGAKETVFLFEIRRSGDCSDD